MAGLRRFERWAFNTMKRVAAKGGYEYRLLQSRREAREAYRKVLALRGGEPLAFSVSREIREYARDRFGSEKFSPWLEVFAASCGQFREGWVPQDFFEVRVLPVVNPRLIANISNAKSCNSTILGGNYLPDLAANINGTWYLDGETLADIREVKSLVFANSESVYVKRDYMDRGKGIRILTEADFDDYVESTQGDYVIQRPVQQHYSLDRYYAEAVSTLRVLTFAPEGGPPVFLAAYLRLGRGGSQLVSAAGNAIKIPVISETGEVAGAGLDDEWVLHTDHPDSGVDFAGYHIPSFKHCVSVCEALHKRIPHLALIGWDVVIDHDANPWILEWNAVNPAFQYIEAMAGPLFKNLDMASFR